MGKEMAIAWIMDHGEAAGMEQLYCGDLMVMDLRKSYQQFIWKTAT
jgi:hypothetical protein